MTRPARVGLLPLYLELYDDAQPGRHEEFAPLLAAVTGGLAEREIDVVSADICRVAEHFGAAVARFAEADVDLVVTLHLAYSPSLESIEALTRTRLPVLMLDTTMDAAFGREVGPDRIFLNHGIHGLMDLASVLRRRGRQFEVVAGHVSESDVLDRAAAMARAAYAARCLRSTKALRIGEPFAGMGDFAVAEDTLRGALGITVEQVGTEALADAVAQVTEQELAAEMALDRERFTIDLPEAVHARSVRVGLGVRRVLEDGGYGAFSMNFLAFQSAEGPVDTVPFLEASKAMARGIGYAGEGDVLTASLVGALAAGFGRTTFTEIFCPDWRGDSHFLSHMGEFNPEVAAEGPRLIEKPFPYTPAQNPAVLVAAPAAGPAVFVNIAPGPQDSFGLVVAPVEILDDTANEQMRRTIRGWMRPRCGVAQFLEAYSRHGGTHHSALVLGDRSEAIAAFARFAGLQCTIIG